MKKKDLASSIHQRLLNIARNENRPMNELLQHFAIERFLFRLSQTEYREKFLLKGAQMLRVWNAPVARPTMDIDLLGKVENDPELLASIVSECCSVAVDDGVIFDESTVVAEPIRRNDVYQGIRITAKGNLANIRLAVQIDVGFGDVVVPSPQKVELPELLDLGAPILLGYTPESTIAEKFQAMVALDMVNTRMKDFYDIWLLLTTLDIDNQDLETAIRKTFARRKTELPGKTPTALTDVFTKNETKIAQWLSFLKKNRIETSLTLHKAANVIKRRLTPLIRSGRP